MVCVDAWAEEVTKRYGAETMAEIEWQAWTDQIAPELERMRQEYLPADVTYEDPNQQVPAEDRASTRVVYTGLFTPRPGGEERTKAELVSWFLGSHEYLLQCIEAWATQITVRYGLDTMFDIQYTLWGDTVLPAVKKLKESYLGITGTGVEDWMKDLQLDATALPGKAFDLTFEMPEPDVGIMTFNRCVAVDQWESMGRPGHPREELPLDLSQVDDRHDQVLRPEHEGRHPGDPAAQGRRRRVLQVAVLDA